MRTWPRTGGACLLSNAAPRRKLRSCGAPRIAAPTGGTGGPWTLRQTAARARLPGLRLPLPVHGRRRRALVPQPRRAAGGGRPRGHLPDAAAVGPARSAADRGRARRRGLRPAASSTGADGNRRIGPPLRFGAGVLRHLLRRGRDYDVVHMCSFPYFSVLAAALARPRGRYRLVVDWFEVWSRDYWREYLGRLGGLAGYAVQRLCVRVPQRAQCFSRLHERRLRRGGPARRARVHRRPVRRPRRSSPSRSTAEPLVVFAGRHIAEKRAPAAVEAIALARAERSRRARPDLRRRAASGPAVLAAIERHGLGGVVDAPGFVDRAEVDDAMRRALCLLHPSAREGYGLVVIESSAHGTPVVVAAGPDNSAVELVDPGRERVRRGLGRSGRARGGDARGRRARVPRCASARGTGSRATSSGSRSRARWSASPRATRGDAARRRCAQALRPQRPQRRRHRRRDDHAEHDRAAG